MVNIEPAVRAVTVVTQIGAGAAAAELIDRAGIRRLPADARGGELRDQELTALGHSASDYEALFAGASASVACTMSTAC